MNKRIANLRSPYPGDHHMLVLTRKATENNDTILIGDNIVIRILEINSGRVSIGIQAPEDITIRRGELKPENVSVRHDE